MNTSNPTMNASVFSRAAASASDGSVMTVNGTVTKTLFLLFILVLAAGWVWSRVYQPAAYGSTAVLNPGSIQGYMLVGGIGGLILALVISFKPIWAPFLSPLYAALEGLLIGGLTVLAESRFPGLPMQAAGLTFGVLAAMLVAYRAKLIRPTERFKSCMTAAIGGIFLVYLVSMVLSFFGTSIPYIHGSGPIGIGFSLFVVGIASFSLIMDFELIEQGANSRAPKFMEWYGGFALMVTLVWLYIEIVQLLMKLAQRDD